MLEINKIYHGDCLELIKQIDNECIDLIVTDPPYNTGMNQTNTSSLNHPSVRFNNSPTWLGNFFNDNYTNEEYFKLIQTCCKEFYRVLKQDSCGYLFMSWKKMGLWKDELEKNGFIVKNVIIWDKIIHGLNYQNYAYCYEMIIFFVKGDYFPKNKLGNFYKDVWRIKRDLNNFLTINEEIHHETIKQIEVIRKCILHGSKENDLILDSFMGSGTTAVACKQLNRNFIGIEIREDYVKLAQERYNNAEINLMNFFENKNG